MDWQALRDEAASQFYVVGSPRSYFPQLTAISSILGVSLLFGLVSVFLRVRQGTFWLFRRTETSDGQRYLEPHSIHPFLLGSIIFLCAAQHFAETSRQATVVGSDLHNIIFYRTYLWPILWMSGYFVAWAQYIASLELEDHSRKRPSARLVNLAFLAIPPIFAAALIPLIVLSNQYFNSAFAALQILDAELVVAIGNTAAGKTVDIFSLEAAQLVLQAQGALAVTYWGRVWIAFTCALAVSTAIFAFSWGRYARSLSHSMTVLRLQRAAGSTFLSHFRAVKVEYRSMFATAITFTLVHALYIGEGLWVSLKTHDIVTSPRIGMYAILISLYIYTILGFFAHVVILIRSIDWNYVNNSKQSAHQTSTVNLGLQDGKASTSGLGNLSAIHTSHEAVRSYDSGHQYSAHDVELQAVGKERPFA